MKSLRDDEEQMSELSGFKIKYQEARGSVLTNAFDKNLGRGQHCGRNNCPPCQNNDKKGICKARNIMYESRCKICNTCFKLSNLILSKINLDLEWE